MLAAAVDALQQAIAHQGTELSRSDLMPGFVGAGTVRRRIRHTMWPHGGGGPDPPPHP